MSNTCGVQGCPQLACDWAKAANCPDGKLSCLSDTIFVCDCPQSNPCMYNNGDSGDCMCTTTMAPTSSPYALPPIEEGELRPSQMSCSEWEKYVGCDGDIRCQVDNPFRSCVCKDGTEISYAGDVPQGLKGCGGTVSPQFEPEIDFWKRGWFWGIIVFLVCFIFGSLGYYIYWRRRIKGKTTLAISPDQPLI